jgi:hypothetical protein
MTASHIEVPARESVPGLWVDYGTLAGYLTRANIEGFYNWFKLVLQPYGADRDGAPYTWVAVNEGNGYRPEVETGRRVRNAGAQGLNFHRENESFAFGEDHHVWTTSGFNVHDDYGVWGIAVGKTDEPTGYRSEEPRFAVYVEAKVRNSLWTVTFRHRAPAGFRMYWTIAMEPDPVKVETRPVEVDGYTHVAEVSIDGVGTLTANYDRKRPAVGGWDFVTDDENLAWTLYEKI